MRRVLLAVDASTADLTADDRVLADALGRRGVEAVPHRWGEPVEPGSVVVVRSTWDYVERPGEFLAWLDHLDGQRATVLNPTGVLRWSMHKGYLLDLERRGVPIVPTELVARGVDRGLEVVLVARGWDDVVVKPAIGGTARLAVHSGVAGVDAAGAHLERLVADEDVIVQPVVESIRTEGEVSIVAVGGEPLAAIVKRPSAGEWRVQSDFGGTAELVPLDGELVAVARVALADRATDYARIDVARHDGRWVVLELELVEPELFFRLAPTVADRLAERIAGGRRSDSLGPAVSD